MWKFMAIIGASVAFLAYKLAKTSGLSNLAELLSYEISKPYNLSVADGNLLFKLDLLLVNPTDETLTFDQPYIKILYNESQLAYTVPETKNYTLLPKSQLKITAIAFKIALSMQFAQIIFSLLKGGKDYVRALGLFNPLTKVSSKDQEALLTEIQNDLFSKLGVVVQLTVMGVPIVFTKKNLS